MIKTISVDELYGLTANPQNQQHKIQSNIFENIFQAADHQKRTLELFTNLLKQLFLQLHLWKNIFSSLFYQSIFFDNLFTKNAVGLMLKHSLPAGDAKQVSIFFLLHKIKISKQQRFILSTISKVLIILFLLCLWEQGKFRQL